MKKIFYGDKKNISGERIYEMRKKFHMSQSELAVKMQVMGVIVEQDVISRIENGRRIITDYELYAICRIFEVSSDWVLGLE